jgi:hypothetical protein
LSSGTMSTLPLAMSLPNWIAAFNCFSSIFVCQHKTYETNGADNIHFSQLVIWVLVSMDGLRQLRYQEWFLQSNDPSVLAISSALSFASWPVMAGLCDREKSILFLVLPRSSFHQLVLSFIELKCLQSRD